MLIIDEKRIYQKIYDMDLPDDASDVVLISQNNYKKYHNCTTGVSGKSIYNDVVRKNRKTLYIECKEPSAKGYFTVYNNEFNVIVIIPVHFNTTTPVEGEKRYWHKKSYHTRFCFVFNKNGECFIPYECKDYDEYFFNVALDVYATNKQHCLSHKNMNKSIEILSNYFGYVFNKRNLDYESFSLSENIIGLINQPEIKELDSQKEVQKLIDIDLKNISDKNIEKMFDLTKKSHRQRNNDWLSYYTAYFDSRLPRNKTRRHAIIEKVNSITSVIRIFFTIMNPLQFDNKEKYKLCDKKQILPCEIIRIYITDDDMFMCKKYCDKWFLTQEYSHAKDFSFLLIDAPEDAINNCKLKYFHREINQCLISTNNTEDIFKTNNQDDTWAKDSYEASIQLYSLLESNLCESIMKAYPEGIGTELSSLVTTLPISNALRRLFGEINEQEKSLTKAIGLPSFMLKELDQKIVEYREKSKKNYKKIIIDILCLFKDIFEETPSYLQNMNQAMFKEMLNKYIGILIKISKTNKYSNSRTIDIRFDDEKDTIIQTLKKLIDLKGVQNILSYLDAIMNIVTMSDAYAIVYYYDYLNICRILVFNSNQDFFNAHHNVVAIYNLKKDKKKEELINNRFKKLTDKWKQLSYSEEKFSITYPRDYMDIINEGIELCHCVKSYIDEVSIDKTTILFVRKTDDINTPFSH